MEMTQNAYNYQNLYSRFFFLYEPQILKIAIWFPKEFVSLTLCVGNSALHSVLVILHVATFCTLQSFLFSIAKSCFVFSIFTLKWFKVFQCLYFRFLRGDRFSLSLSILVCLLCTHYLNFDYKIPVIYCDSSRCVIYLYL